MKYDDSNRGRIQNRERARQIIDFNGIRYNNITPTDIDGFFEYKNKAFVFFEYKLRDADVPRGQELALMRVVDGLSAAGKNAVLFLCRHSEDNPHKDIRAAEALVEKIYWCGKWHTGTNKTVKAQTDRFLRWVETLGENVNML